LVRHIRRRRGHKKVEASRENPFTNGITCPRAAGDPKRVTSPDRVLYPYVRVGGMENWKKVDLGQALDLLVDRLRETIAKHGRESVLLLDYAGNTGFIANGYSKRIWNALGVTTTDYALCSASGHAGISLHYGLTYGSNPLELEKKKNIIFWGFNAKTSSPHQWALAEKARRLNNANIVSIDPRESETAQASSLWIALRPGTDVALAYGLARYIITNDIVDLEFIEKYTHGYELYRKEALTWTPERVQRTTGVKWSQIEELGGMLRGSRSVFMIGLGLNKSLTGAESCRAVSLLPALLGEHRGFYYTNSRGNYIMGDPQGRGLTGKTPYVVGMVSLGERLAAGEFKLVYVAGMNPALTLPDSHKVIAGFKREDCFLVVHDTHWTETANLADLVLPATTYLEKDDVYVSDCHPFIRLGRKAIDPLGESVDEHPLMLEIARRLNISEPWVYVDPWMDMRKNFKDAFTEHGFNDLLMGKPLQIRYRPIDEYQTGSGKLEFASTTAPRGVSPLPKQLDIGVKADELIMLNSSLPQYTHTQFRDVYGVIPSITWVNPIDAEKYGLRDGEKHILYNTHGQLEVRVVVTRRVMPGVIWCPRELVDDRGSPQNGLAPGTPQKIGGGPIFNTIKVRFK